MSLVASNISMSFGAITALKDIDLQLNKGEILGLIGPNGAGKTTLVNIVSGFQKPTTGKVHADGTDLSAFSPQARSYSGVVRTFQGRRIFPSMTVLENVMIGALGQGAGLRDAEAQAGNALLRVGLKGNETLPATRLTYGQERQLDLARALATNPSYLLLDEPAAGMNEGETAGLKRVVQQIVSDLGIGVLLIEHDMTLVMGVCDRVHVLVKGETLTVGTPLEVRKNPEVMLAYLGTSAGALV